MRTKKDRSLAAKKGWRLRKKRDAEFERQRAPRISWLESRIGLTAFAALWAEEYAPDLPLWFWDIPDPMRRISA